MSRPSGPPAVRAGSGSRAGVKTRRGTRGVRERRERARTDRVEARFAAPESDARPSPIVNRLRQARRRARSEPRAVLATSRTDGDASAVETANSTASTRGSESPMSASTAACRRFMSSSD